MGLRGILCSQSLIYSGEFFFCVRVLLLLLLSVAVVLQYWVDIRIWNIQGRYSATELHP